MKRAWLTEHLIRSGHVTESGLTRRARIKVCRCGARTLTGLDADLCALEAACDPEPVNALGEALALLEGRWTYALHRAGNGFELNRRHQLAIAARPAGGGVREDVLREHRCGSPVPDQLHADTTFGEIASPLPADAVPGF